MVVGGGGIISRLWHALSLQNDTVGETRRSKGVSVNEGECDHRLLLQLQLQVSVEGVHVLLRVLLASWIEQCGLSRHVTVESGFSCHVGEESLDLAVIQR